MPNRLTLPARFALLCITPLAWAGPIVDIAAEASQPAKNDLVRATLFAEAGGASPKPLAAKVNAQMADALRVSKAVPGVKSESGATRTYPIYGKDGQIASWRMRSELLLEGRDVDKLAELVGRLQESLGIAQIEFMPAPETRKAAEAAAIRAAIAAFQARAALVGETLDKPYQIKQMSINTSGMHRPTPVFYRKAAPLLADAAAPMPMEAGESEVQVQVSGQIELGDSADHDRSARP